MKVIIKILTLSSLIGIIYGGSVSAASDITYQSTINPTFTINPSLSVSLSSPNLVISDLMPGQSNDSNEIVVTVLSNNKTGYVLNSSVGSSTYNNRNLTNTADNSAIFSSIDYSSTPTVTELTTPNTWAYSYASVSSDDDNGNVVYNDWSNYNGLPLYSDTTNVAILNSNSGPSLSTGDKLKFKIAALADTEQLSGEYNNIVNFTVVGNTVPTTLYQAFYEASQSDPSITQKNGYYKMQDMSPAICSAVTEIPSETSLIDVRDNEVYLIGKLKDGRCWMKDNLRLGSNSNTITLHNTDTNINAASWSLPQGITSGFTGYTNAHINAAYKDDVPEYHYGTGSGKVGVYYNFCAASAGTYCYDPSSGTGNANYDVCPANWRMPTGGDNGEYQYLYNYYGAIQPPTDINSFRYNFSASFSGRFYDSAQYNLDIYGDFWSSTYSDTNLMYILSLSSKGVVPTNDNYRAYGYPIRCIANN